MPRSDNMRVLLIALLALLVLGCSSPTPTPTPTPTPDPLERALAVVDTIKQAIQSVGSTEDLAALTDTVSAEATEVLCDVAAGVYEPHLSLGDLTDRTSVQLGIRGFCATR